MEKLFCEFQWFIKGVIRLEGKAGSTGAKIFCLEILRAFVLKVLKCFCFRGFFFCIFLQARISCEA